MGFSPSFFVGLGREEINFCGSGTGGVWEFTPVSPSNLDELTKTVTSYISFCEDMCIPTRTRLTYIILFNLQFWQAKRTNSLLEILLHCGRVWKTSPVRINNWQTILMTFTVGLEKQTPQFLRTWSETITLSSWWKRPSRGCTSFTSWRTCHRSCWYSSTSSLNPSSAHQNCLVQLSYHIWPQKTTEGSPDCWANH